jgi:hypothetical protein
MKEIDLQDSHLWQAGAKYAISRIRPYVELAELVFNSKKVYVLNTQEERKRFNDLIEMIDNQIKGIEK